MRLRAAVACIFCALACVALHLTLTKNPRGVLVMPHNAGPDVTLLLLALGALGICAEFLLPGGIVSGVAGSVLMLLGWAALSAFPLDWRGIALIVVAVLLVMAEARYIARAKYAACAALTMAGSLCMLAGTMTLIRGEAPGGRVHPAVAMAIAFSLTPLASFLYYVAIRARLNKTLFLADRAVFQNGCQSNVILRGTGPRPDQTTQSEAGQSQT